MKKGTGRRAQGIGKNFILAFLLFNVCCLFLIFNLFSSTDTTSAATQVDPPSRPIVIDWHSSELVRTLKGHSGTVDSLAFSPNGILASGGGYDDTKIHLWQPGTGKEVGIIQVQPTAVRAIAITPDSKTLVSCGDDTTINLWNLSTHHLSRTFREHTSNVLSLAVTPDSQILVSGALDGIRLWRLDQERPFYTLVHLDNLIHAVAISLDGQLLASGDDRGTIKLWSLKTYQLVRTLVGHSGTVSSLVFTPDGTLISGSHDRTIKLWGASTGGLVRTLTGHTDWVNAVAINPDGDTLASGGKDGIKLWQISSGELINTLTGHTDWVSAIAFSPDGEMLASGSFDKTVKIWYGGS